MHLSKFYTSFSSPSFSVSPPPLSLSLRKAPFTTSPPPFSPSAPFHKHSCSSSSPALFPFPPPLPLLLLIHHCDRARIRGLAHHASVCVASSCSFLSHFRSRSCPHSFVPGYHHRRLHCRWSRYRCHRRRRMKRRRRKIRKRIPRRGGGRGRYSRLV